MGKVNQYIQLVKIVYCTLRTISRQLPTFPHKVRGLNHQPQRWEASVLPLCHHGLQLGKHTTYHFTCDSLRQNLNDLNNLKIQMERSSPLNYPPESSIFSVAKQLGRTVANVEQPYDIDITYHYVLRLIFWILRLTSYTLLWKWCRVILSH